MAKKYIIFGGAGLIGSAIAEAASAAREKVVIIDLPDRVARKDYKRIPGVVYRGENILKPGIISELLYEYRPDVVITTVNVATIFSHNYETGYKKLVNFYTELYRALKSVSTPLHYIQVGTTGSGGLGFNIPFTHGDALEDMPIIHKAAFAGVSTALLTMLSRSFGHDHSHTKVSEIKPGLAIFANRIQVQELGGCTYAVADGGESGPYTYDELALLTSMMGFTTAESIAHKVLEVIQGKRAIRRVVAHDLTEVTNATIIASTKADEKKRARLLRSLKNAQKECAIIATGSLGPPSITGDLLIAYAIIHRVQITVDDYFFAGLQHNPSIKATCEFIKDTNPELYTFLKGYCTYERYQILVQKKHGHTEPWQIIAR